MIISLIFGDYLAWFLQLLNASLLLIDWLPGAENERFRKCNIDFICLYAGSLNSFSGFYFLIFSWSYTHLFFFSRTLALCLRTFTFLRTFSVNILIYIDWGGNYSWKTYKKKWLKEKIEETWRYFSKLHNIYDISAQLLVLRNSLGSSRNEIITKIKFN